MAASILFRPQFGHTKAKWEMVLNILQRKRIDTYVDYM